MATQADSTIGTISSEVTKVLGQLQNYYNTTVLTNYVKAIGENTQVMQDMGWGGWKSQTTFDAQITVLTNLISGYTQAVNNIQWPTASFLTLPSLPTGVDTTPKWNSTGTTDWTTLKTALKQFYVTANSLTEVSDISTAMYNDDVARKQRVLLDLYNAANWNTANKGFLYPNSLTVALKLSAQEKHQYDLKQVSRDIVKYVTEWAKSNYQHAVDKMISAQQIDIEFNLKYPQIQVEVYRDVVKAIVEKFESEVRAYVAKIDAMIKPIQTLVELAKTQSSLNMEYDKILVERYMAVVKDFHEAADLTIRNTTADIKSRAEVAQISLNALTALASTVSSIDIRAAALP
jgi:hypothetical protein